MLPVFYHIVGIRSSILANIVGGGQAVDGKKVWVYETEHLCYTFKAQRFLIF